MKKIQDLFQKDKIFAIIVTYGNRYEYLSKTIQSLINEGIKNLIIVDNNSHKKTKKYLKEIKKKITVKIISLQKNLGSAGGFKLGIKEAIINDKCEFLLLLDDDNIVSKNSIDIVNYYWNFLSQTYGTKIMIAYLRDKLKKDLIYGNFDIKKNSFLGFHVFYFLKKIFIKRKEYNYENFMKGLLKYVEVPYAPYGGLFFHKSVIKDIGLPNEKLFIYSDDHEFTYRLTKQGGKIFIITEIYIKDIEKSWHEKNNKMLLSILENLRDKENSFRVYYFFRNRIYFEKLNLVDNNFIYYINILIFLFVLFCVAFYKGEISSLFTIIKAIKDGIKMAKNSTLV